MKDLENNNSSSHMIINGTRFDFEIQFDFTVLCSYCGAACMGTYLLWYVRDGRCIALETDRGTLDDIINYVVGASIERNDYATLPAFFRDWNECSGWCEAEHGAILDREDLMRAVSTMETATNKAIDPKHSASTLAGIRTLIAESISVGSDLWMIGN